MNQPLLICGLLLSGSLMAQQNQEPAATEEPLDHIKASPDDATNIKVIVQKHQTIEEYRQRGELVLVKVIPNEGAPYFIDPLERQKRVGRSEDLINSGVKPVHWVLKEF